MKPYLVPVLAVLFVLCGVGLCVLVAVRASPRSNTRSFRESVTVTFRNAVTEDVQDHTLLALPELLRVVQEFGASLAKYLIHLEAGKYQATSSASTSLTLKGWEGGMIGQAQLKQGGYFIFLRTVEDLPSRKTGLPPFDRAARGEHAKKIHEALKRHCAQVEESEILRILEQGCLTNRILSTENTTLACCAIGLVRQRQTHRSFELQLLGYIYPALKAKNAAFKVPFTKWHQTESKLHVSLEGPLADGRSFQAGADFDLEWDREQALANRPATWRLGDERHGYVLSRSKPVAVPGFQDFTLNSILTESSDMGKTLEKATSLASKLKP